MNKDRRTHERRIADLEQSFNDRLEASHIAIAGTVSNHVADFRNDLKELRVLIEEHIQRTEGDTEMRAIMKDVAESYKAFSQLGKITKWVASIALSLGSVYIFFEHIVKHLAK